jgi:ankyrin repeat protein
MEEKLDKFMAEVRAGLREGSVISTHTAHTVEQMDVDELWIGLHRELEDVGISPQLLNEKKDFIVAWFKTAIAEGTLEEMPSSDCENLQPPRLTISPPQREAFDPAQPPFTPSSRLSERQPGSISGAVPARLSPRTLSPSTASGPLVRRRSSSRLSVRRLLGKILQDDKKFLAAAAAGKIATVAEQLKHGVDPDAKDETSLKTALHHATEHGHEDIVLLLLEYGANVNAIEKAGSSVLHIALEMGNVEIVKFLLDYGANVNTSQTDGSSLLHKAIETGHIEIFALLLQYGGNVNATQKYGSSLLHLAVETDQVEFIRLLLAYGAAKDAKNDNGVTALYLATEQSKKDALSLLLDGGCDTETTCVNGWTPLHCAAHLGYEGIVELLLNYGANMGAKGDDEATALHNAAKNGHEAVAIIRQHF